MPQDPQVPAAGGGIDAGSGAGEAGAAVDASGAEVSPTPACDAVGGRGGGEDAVQGAHPGGDGEPVGRGRVLDEEMFSRFSALLAACQAYADLTGCRFRVSSFDGLPGCGLVAGHGDDGGETSEEETDDEPEYVIVPFPSSCGHGGTSSPRGWQELGEALQSAQPVGGVARGGQLIAQKDPGPLLAAKLRAAPAVRRFARRLRRADDPALLQELHTAFDLTMEEALRRSMIATFQRLDLWPPRPAPRFVGKDDCEYQDLRAPLPVIAQRAFNDELRRAQDGVAPSTGRSASTSRSYRRAMTAAFIVDFAHEVGVQLPPMTDDQQQRFQRFEAKAAELEEHQRLEQQMLHAQESARLRERPSLLAGSAVAAVGRRFARRILFGAGGSDAEAEVSDSSFASCRGGSVGRLRQELSPQVPHELVAAA